MPLGYGGYEKDNTLAYSDTTESPEAKKARKEAKVEKQRRAEVKAAVTRRKRLAKIVVDQNKRVLEESEQVTEADLEFIHGDKEYEVLQRQKCCDERYVEAELEHGRAQLDFIRRALFPVMIGYGVTTLYCVILVFSDTVRLFFYLSSPIYALISLGCWIGLNIFGRLIRNTKFVIPMMFMRSAAVCNLFAASQIYSEYFIWEILFHDPSDDENPIVVEMEERLKNEHHFPESWLDLPEDTTKNDFLKRAEFTRAFFGALLGFSFFFPLFCIIVGLTICSKRKHLHSHQVTGDWMKRAGAIAGIAPSIIVFFANDYLHFIPGPRSYDFIQTYPIGLISMGFGVYASAMWSPLFAGKSCFNVHNEDYLYFGFMFTI